MCERIKFIEIKTSESIQIEDNSFEGRGFFSRDNVKSLSSLNDINKIEKYINPLQMSHNQII